jgi:uncharacterized membrane protein YfcA
LLFDWLSQATLIVTAFSVGYYLFILFGLIYWDIAFANPFFAAAIVFGPIGLWYLMKYPEKVDTAKSYLLYYWVRLKGRFLKKPPKKPAESSQNNTEADQKN